MSRNLISQVHAALKRVSGGQAAAPAEPLKPAVPIKRSVTPEYIVCLEDGQKVQVAQSGICARVTA